ncbi:hypothetical protein FHG87_006775, partial [Trinorchestia longiramus]
IMRRLSLRCPSGQQRSSLSPSPTPPGRPLSSSCGVSAATSPVPEDLCSPPSVPSLVFPVSGPGVSVKNSIALGDGNASPQTSARRLVSSRSLGSTSSPPMTPGSLATPVTGGGCQGSHFPLHHTNSYGNEVKVYPPNHGIPHTHDKSAFSIPPCLPSHQHHAKLPATPGLHPACRSLPALHGQLSTPPHPHHTATEKHLHTSPSHSSSPFHRSPSHHSSSSSHSSLANHPSSQDSLSLMNHHSSHPSLHVNAPLSPSKHPTVSLYSGSPHASPPTSRPHPGGHFSHASVLGRSDSLYYHRQLPGLPRHHTIGGVGGRLLPAAPSISSTPPPPQSTACHSSHESPQPPSSPCLLGARPAHALHSANYKYSLDVPRVNLRDLRSNTYPPPGVDGSPSSSSSSS